MKNNTIINWEMDIDPTSTFFISTDYIKHTRNESLINTKRRIHKGISIESAISKRYNQA